MLLRDSESPWWASRRSRLHRGSYPKYHLFRLPRDDGRQLKAISQLLEMERLARTYVRVLRQPGITCSKVGYGRLQLLASLQNTGFLFGTHLDCQSADY